MVREAFFLLKSCCNVGTSPRLQLSAFVKHILTPHARFSFQSNKVSLLALLPGRVRLNAVDLLKQLFEPHFQGMVLSTGEEFTEIVTTSRKGIIAKGQASHAEILECCQSSPHRRISHQYSPSIQHDPIARLSATASPNKRKASHSL